jgi:HSP20 family protein
MAEMKKNDQNVQGQNVPVRQQSSQQNVPARQEQTRGELQRSPWQLMRDPFAMMREMFRDPFGDFYRNPFGMMRDMFREPMGMQGADFNPQIEVRETTEAFLIKADMPGIKKDDIEINLHGSRLTISGKREQEHEEKSGDQIYAYERSFGSFTRAFTLPDTVDTEHITSELKEGVLSLVIPKKASSQPRKIQIGAGSKA